MAERRARLTPDMIAPCAGAGLQATPHQGKRRSTRTSCKPLEWWRNEIKVYERKFRSAPFHAPLLLCVLTP